MEPRQRQTLEEWLGDVPGEKPNPVLLPRRKEAAKGVRLGPVAPAVSKWSSDCRQKW